jgi:tight adherence protein C
MIEQLHFFLRADRMAMILVALSAFATVLTLAAPFLAGDRLRSRMKAIGVERDRLRSSHRATLGESRLRDRPKGPLANLVEKFNLRSLLQAESSRDLLRQAGYRSETNLVTFLVIRAIAPVAVGLITFVYSSVMFDTISSNMRMGAVLTGVVVGFYAPSLFLKNLAQKRQFSIKRAWSDALDLLLICVESGMSIELALQRVSKEISSASVPLAEELTLTNAELSYLPERRKAYENLAKRTGLQTVKSVVTSLIQSERYGTPLGNALRVLGQENRDARMQEAEKKAAALPPKLTVPMVLFFLPVIFVVILGPSIILVMKAQ